MKTIYLVLKINKKSLDIKYVFGAYTDIKEAQSVCDGLNETIIKDTYIVQRSSLKEK